MKMSFVGNDLDNIDRDDKKYRGIQRKKRILLRITKDQIKELEPYLRFLNPKDRDILYLIGVSGFKQGTVQKILNRKQSSICYDIKRIRERLAFIYFLICSFDIFLDIIQNKRGYFDEFTIKVLIMMFYSTSLSVSSEILGVSQICIRYRLTAAIDRMKENGWMDAHDLFSKIKDKYNIIKRSYKKSGFKD